MNGILVLDKPQDFTSHDCVAVIRKLTGVKKVGHTGTLDPMAEGVLPVCIGRATRIIEYLEESGKEYRCTMQLGIATDTFDIWGNVIEKKTGMKIPEEKIISAVMAQTGDMMQTPPIYSAIKIKGRKLYDYARSGQKIIIEPRPVHIESIVINDIRGMEAEFTVRCSRGTYIRSLCSDIGRSLGCGAAMSALTRVSSGPFRIEDSVSMGDLRRMSAAEIEALLIPMDFPLDRFMRTDISTEEAKDLIDGKVIGEHSTASDKDCGAVLKRVYCDGAFIGIAESAEGKLKAKKILYPEFSK